jgi:hypothetical protein
VRSYLEKKPSQKKADGVAQSVSLDFKPHYCKKKKKMMSEVSFPSPRVCVFQEKNNQITLYRSYTHALAL